MEVREREREGEVLCVVVILTVGEGSSLLHGGCHGDRLDDGGDIMWMLVLLLV